MDESLLNVLKLCLIALLYLFFLRVIRAVWAELRTPKVVAGADEPTSTGRPSAPARTGRTAVKTKGGTLTVIEPPELRGRSYPLGDEVTVGRAAGCQVALDDAFVSQLHARVFRRDGRLYVEDLGSTNGTYVNREKVTGTVALRKGDALQFGHTVLEVG